MHVGKLHVGAASASAAHTVSELPLTEVTGFGDCLAPARVPPVWLPWPYPSICRSNGGVNNRPMTGLFHDSAWLAAATAGYNRQQRSGKVKQAASHMAFENALLTTLHLWSTPGNAIGTHASCLGAIPTLSCSATYSLILRCVVELNTCDADSKRGSRNIAATMRAQPALLGDEQILLAPLHNFTGASHNMPQPTCRLAARQHPEVCRSAAAVQ
jgi:hypothetical protein